jgi:hypothetical protein
MQTRLLVLPLMVFLFSVTSARAAETEVPPFEPVSFGVNIDQALINPFDDPDTGVVRLRREVATIFYEVRRIGGRTVRWFNDDVWTQYECGKDPENQATGELDLAWYEMARILLEEAQRWHVKVVVSLMDLEGSTFSGLPRDEVARAQAIAGFAAHRAKLAGKDRYQGDHACRNSVQQGYYGATEAQTMLQQPAVREHMQRRFVKMARYLEGFPALGALELFNEPTFNLTHQDLYATTVRQFEDAMHRSDPGMARIPIYSGTAYWDQGIVAAAHKSGDLEQEPFVTVHSYANYARADTERQKRNITWVMGLMPHKQLVIAEAGDESAPLSRQGNAEMVRFLLSEANELHVGLWVWGNDLSQESKASPDYKWSFNPLSLAGGSFRPFFINSDAESHYVTPRSIQVHDIARNLDRSEVLSIAQVPESDANPGSRLRWRLILGDRRFLAFTRDGVLTQNFPQRSTLFAPPAPTVLVNDNPLAREWAEVAADTSHWRLDVYRCQPGSTHGIQTPEYLIGLAERFGRKDFGGCAVSDPILSASIF